MALEPYLTKRFFDFEIDEALLDRVRSLTIFYSDNDSVRVDTAIKIIKKSFKI